MTERINCKDCENSSLNTSPYFYSCPFEGQFDGQEISDEDSRCLSPMQRERIAEFLKEV